MPNVHTINHPDIYFITTTKDGHRVTVAQGVRGGQYDGLQGYGKNQQEAYDDLKKGRHQAKPVIFTVEGTSCTPISLPTFQAADWFNITGRGRVAAINGIEGFDPRPLLNQEVLIDGLYYRVRGVETFLIPDPSGKSFGLLTGHPIYCPGDKDPRCRAICTLTGYDVNGQLCIGAGAKIQDPDCFR